MPDVVPQTATEAILGQTNAVGVDGGRDGFPLARR